MAHIPVRYIFTNISSEDIFLTGVNVTIKAGKSITLTPIEIDDIEEYYDLPEVKDNKIKIEIVGEDKDEKYTILNNSSVFSDGEISKNITFVTSISLPYTIILTPNDNVNVYYTNKQTTGFTINLSAPPNAGETIVVDYAVIKKNE